MQHGNTSISHTRSLDYLLAGVSVSLDALDGHALPVRAPNSVSHFPQAALAQPSSEQELRNRKK